MLMQREQLCRRGTAHAGCEDRQSGDEQCLPSYLVVVCVGKGGQAVPLLAEAGRFVGLHEQFNYLLHS